MHLRANGVGAVTSSAAQLIPPHTGRTGLLISAPPPQLDAQQSADVLTGAVDTSTTGVKSSYTVPAGVQATLTMASWFETTGTTVVAALELVRGATTYTLASSTAKGTFAGPLVLASGDKIQWDVTTAVALSVADFALFVTVDNGSGRITLLFGDGAVLDQGINIYPGQAPLYLTGECAACALAEGVSAISSGPTFTVGWVDFFG